jgi:uncharacterized protein YbcC (UPF0753/DUF2309 family)
MKLHLSLKSERVENTSYKNDSEILDIAVEQSWSKIAPFWPLKNLIAVNPLQGFEDSHFDDAISYAHGYFQQKHLPMSMKSVNRETIKWLQVFFDEGQATIKMPLRNQGLLESVLKLLSFDKNICSSQEDQEILKRHTNNCTSAKCLIGECLLFLGISETDYNDYLTLMLTTLPGWASYIQYLGAWSSESNQITDCKVKEDYLALRLLITRLLWPKAIGLLDRHKCAIKNTNSGVVLDTIKKSENGYRTHLLEKLSSKKNTFEEAPKAQFVFCIDVRSEPFRRSLENQGNYQTFGFAGFFGIPVSIKNDLTGEKYASCPVLLKPAHNINDNHSHSACEKNYKQTNGFKQLYQSLKYNITSPFALVETIGAASGFWMFARSLSPNFAHSLKNKLSKLSEKSLPSAINVDSITFEDQSNYAANALKMMGLTNNFAPLVFLCGHGSSTTNNAYATALDCGACGGRHGGPNARILATILNRQEIRNYLEEHSIYIPKETYFLGAEHNTTTDALTIYDLDSPEKLKKQIADLKTDFHNARQKNSFIRCAAMDSTYSETSASKHTQSRANDWAQVRPEWGLARNASFIVGPRWLTKDIDLEARSFLHSYDWTIDEDGKLLTTILTAPMVVAQWINNQYLFSTLDNVAFGGGSKITKNITGKFGIMQGNASDIMHGLPLQSVFKKDIEAYHEPLRLLTVVYASRSLIDKIIAAEEVLKKLFANEWVHLACIEPDGQNTYILDKELNWTRMV